MQQLKTGRYFRVDPKRQERGNEWGDRLTERTQKAGECGRSKIRAKNVKRDPRNGYGQQTIEGNGKDQDQDICKHVIGNESVLQFPITRTR